MGAALTGIRILHVDDEADIREIVGMSLSLDEGFQVRSCASGTEAVVAAAEWSPYLILLDVMMPGMDGLATLAQLRKNPSTADIPVMFMTARAQTHEIDYFVLQGAHGVIAKPFDPLTLAFRVRNRLMAIRVATLGYAFATRAKLDTNLLEPLRAAAGKETSPTDLARIRVIANGLIGAADLFRGGSFLPPPRVPRAPPHPHLERPPPQKCVFPRAVFPLGVLKEQKKSLNPGIPQPQFGATLTRH